MSRYNSIAEAMQQLEKCKFIDEVGNSLENNIAFTYLRSLIHAKMNKTLILISGYKRSGKDYVGDILKNAIPDSEIVRFADPMKHILSTTLGISLEELESRKNRDLAERKYLQMFGNKAMKPWFGEAVWAKLLLSKGFTSSTVIVPDFRFNIEYETMLNQFERVVTVRVIDSNLKSGNHPSESELDGFNFNYYIDNTEKSEYTEIQVRGLAVILKGTKND